MEGWRTAKPLALVAIPLSFDLTLFPFLASYLLSARGELSSHRSWRVTFSPLAVSYLLSVRGELVEA